MASLSISETQFVFTYFHKFASFQKKNWYQFVFPSLRQEGDPDSKYSGADLVISKNLFIQFKIPYFLKTSGTPEFNKYNAGDLFETPFFRVKIKNRLLSGKRNSGQFEMLQKIARSGKSAQYIFPMFNHLTESDNPSQPNYWFNAFYQKEARRSLNDYCLSVDFADMLGSDFSLGNTDSHTLCSNYETAMDKGNVYVFSTAKYVRSKKFNSAIINEDILTWTDEQEKSVSNTINEILELLELKDESFNKINTISSLQNYLIRYFDIYWIPVLKSTQ